MSWSWSAEREYWAWEIPKLWRVGKWVLLAVILLSFVGTIPGVGQVMNLLIVAIPVVAIARRVVAIRHFDRIAHARWQARISKWIRENWPGLARSLRLEVRGIAGNPIVAAVGRPVWSEWSCVVPVALPAGLVREDLVAVTGHIAQALGAVRVTLLGNHIGALELRVEYVDVLGQPFSFPLGGSWDGKTVLLGDTESGAEWRMPIGPHTLVAGSSGSGKASLVWGLLLGLVQPIHQGLIEVWGATARAAWNSPWGVTC